MASRRPQVTVIGLGPDGAGLDRAKRQADEPVLTMSDLLLHTADNAGLRCTGFSEYLAPAATADAWLRARDAWRRNLATAALSDQLNLGGVRPLWCVKLEALRIAVYLRQIGQALRRTGATTILADPDHMDLLCAVELSGVRFVARPLRKRLPPQLKNALRLAGAGYPSVPTGPTMTRRSQEPGRFAVFLPLDSPDRSVNTQATLAVADAWVRDGNSGRIVVARQDIAQACSGADLPLLPLSTGRHAPRPDELRASYRIGRRIRPVDLTADHPPVEPVAWSLALRQLARHVLERNFWHKVVQRLDPAALFVVPDTVPMGRCAISVLHDAGLPSVTANAVLMTEHPMYDDLAAHRACVLGPRRSEHLQRVLGVAADRVLPTGVPNWDPLGPGDSTRVKIPANRPKAILYATEHTGMKQMTAALGALADWTDRNTEYAVIVRNHPADDADSLRDAIARLAADDRIVVDRSVDLADQLAAASAVTVGFSSVGAMAIQAGKPLVSIDLTGIGRGGCAYCQAGAALCADTPEQFRTCLDRLATGQASASLAAGRQRYMREVLSHPPGGAGQAVARALSQVADWTDLPRLRA